MITSIHTEITPTAQQHVAKALLLASTCNENKTLINDEMIHNLVEAFAEDRRAPVVFENLAAALVNFSSHDRSPARLSEQKINALVTLVTVLQNSKVSPKLKESASEILSTFFMNECKSESLEEGKLRSMLAIIGILEGPAHRHACDQFKDFVIKELEAGRLDAACKTYLQTEMKNMESDVSKAFKTPTGSFFRGLPQPDQSRWSKALQYLSLKAEKNSGAWSITDFSDPAARVEIDRDKGAPTTWLEFKDQVPGAGAGAGGSKSPF